MGVNYYLKKLPSKERKEELIEAVKKDDVNTIRNLTNNMYNNLIHLGKSSIGWQSILIRITNYNLIMKLVT